MAGEWFAGLGQTIAGGIATGATLGLCDSVTDWTVEGAHKVRDNSEKAWGDDGEVTQFLEAIPGVGYIASAGHAMAGDEQRARRACASSTRSTLVTGGAVGGFMVGGPAGAAAGAAAGSAAGQCAEMGINHAIDEQHRTDAGTFHEFDGAKFTQYILVDGAIAGIAPVASRGAVGSSLKQGGKTVVSNHGRYVVKRGVEKGVACAGAAVNKSIKH